MLRCKQASQPGADAGPGREVTTIKQHNKAKRYKYQALVSLDPHDGGSAEAALRGPACRMVVRARHRDTGRCKFFSALVTPGDIAGTFRLGDRQVVVRFVVLGDDVCDYLAPGDHFDLWRGTDVGHGVVSRRLFI